ncbi:MAG TPA: polymer-forming cytoskeletal protein [Spirochaetota bacterium]|nr:polymer-forming cytoskeletal protein [Spirochaetota bacterium]
MKTTIVSNVIAQTSTVEGDVTAGGVLRIEGCIKGTVYCKNRVYVAQTAIINGNIHCYQLVIGGRVYGNVYAGDSVKLLKSGFLQGDLFAASFATDEGAVFKGECNIIK